MGEQQVISLLSQHPKGKADGHVGSFPYRSEKLSKELAQKVLVNLITGNVRTILWAKESPLSKKPLYQPRSFHSYFVIWIFFVPSLETCTRTLATVHSDREGELSCVRDNEIWGDGKAVLRIQTPFFVQNILSQLSK